MRQAQQRSVLRHTMTNLAGLGLPLVAAVFTIPPLIRGLGEERFGLLTLMWAIVGYFGLFDFGLGRALTQQISVLAARREQERIGRLIATSLVVLVGLGLLAGFAIWATADWGVTQIKGVSERQDAVGALRVMGLAMPFIVLTSGLRGILEARFAFGALNLIRIPMGLLTFLGPLAVVDWWSSKLTPVAWVLTVGRVLACMGHAWFARRDLFAGRLDRSQLRPLLGSGGWLTVSNIVSPLMGYADRFIIGGTLSAGVVAYYTTPNEMILKIWIIPGALTAVLFPRFAYDVVRDPTTTWTLFKKAVSAIFLVILPIALALALFAHEVLSLWIGEAFAEQSAPVLRAFAAGMVLVCAAQVPFTLIQSAGRARATALIHCGIFPIFVTALYFATKRFGLIGAVGAWLFRVILDAVLMFYFAAQTMERSPSTYLHPTVVFGVAGTFLLFLAGALEPFWVRALLLGVGGILSVRAGLPYLKRALAPSSGSPADQ